MFAVDHGTSMVYLGASSYLQTFDLKFDRGYALPVLTRPFVAPPAQAEAAAEIIEPRALAAVDSNGYAQEPSPYRTQGSNHAKTGNGGKIPRPPNAFIIYRNMKRGDVLTNNPGLHNNQICK
jgi:hypothetical protein